MDGSDLMTLEKGTWRAATDRYFRRQFVSLIFFFFFFFEVVNLFRTEFVECSVNRLYRKIEVRTLILMSLLKKNCASQKKTP